MTKKNKNPSREIHKGNGVEKFRAHYNDFSEHLELVVQDARKKAQDTHRELARSLGAIDDSFGKHRAEHLERYRDSVAKARGERDERNLLQAAQISAEETIKKLEVELGKQYEGLLSKQQQELQSLRHQAEESVRNNFHNFLTSVKESWMEAKVVKPEDVALLGEMLVTAALKTRALLEA